MVLACVLPSIHGYNFKVVRQTVWQQLLLEVDRVLVHRQSHVKCLRGATRQCEILCETWKMRYRNVRFVEESLVVTSVYLVLKFSSGLDGLKREGKRSETISAPVVPAHQKQTLESKKVGEIVRQNRRLSIRAVAELINIDKETVRQILRNNLNMKKSVFEDGAETLHS